MALVSTSQFIALIDRMAAQYKILASAYTEARTATSTKAKLSFNGLESSAGCKITSNNGVALHLAAKTVGVDGNSLKIYFARTSSNQNFSLSVFNNEVIIYDLIISNEVQTPIQVLYEYFTQHPILLSKMNLKAVEIPVTLVTSPSAVLYLGASEDEVSYDDYFTGSIASGATPFLGGYSEGSFELEAVNPGFEGNLISITISNPTVVNSPLTISVSGSDITVVLASDGLGKIKTTVNDLVTALNAHTAVSPLVVASLKNGYGSAIASPSKKTYLAGGVTGDYANVVLDCTGGVANGDWVQALLDSATSFPATFTINSLIANTSGWTNLIQGLEDHFTLLSTDIVAYLTDNNLRVPESFSTLYFANTNATLDAVQVFKESSIRLGKATVSGASIVLSNTASLGTGTGAATTTNLAAQVVEAYLTPVQVKASATLLTGNSGLTYTAVDFGTEGNNVQIEYIEPTVHPAPLNVEVQPFNVATAKRKISVNLQTNGSGDVLSTAAQVKAAVEGSAASDWVTVSLVGDGSGVVEGVALTSLAGGKGYDLAEDINFTVTLRTGSTATTVVDQVRFSAGDWIGSKVVVQPRAKISVNSQLRFVAKEPGTLGNQIKISAVNPGVPSFPLSVNIQNNNTIIVQLGTNSSSAVVSTLNDVKEMLELEAGDLIFVDLLASGSTVITPFVQTSLTGGAAAPRAFAVTNVAYESPNLSPGTGGDFMEFFQVVERTPSL